MSQNEDKTSFATKWGGPLGIAIALTFMNAKGPINPIDWMAALYLSIGIAAFWWFFTWAKKNGL